MTKLYLITVFKDGREVPCPMITAGNSVRVFKDINSAQRSLNGLRGRFKDNRYNILAIDTEL